MSTHYCQDFSAYEANCIHTGALVHFQEDRLAQEILWWYGLKCYPNKNKHLENTENKIINLFQKWGYLNE